MVADITTNDDMAYYEIAQWIAKCIQNASMS
jgi:hypothetical protein